MGKSLYSRVLEKCPRIKFIMSIAKRVLKAAFMGRWTEDLNNKMDALAHYRDRCDNRKVPRLF